jgi:hypothetical protein
MALYSTALARILPPGQAVYLALLVKGPEPDGTHETEASYTGYARKAHSAWATHSDMDGSWYLSNTGSIVFGAVTGSAITITHWGLYLGAVGGVLFASGQVLNLSGVPYPQLLQVGDQARFLDDALKIRSGI